jgi:hypothetical protein
LISPGIEPHIKKTHIGHHRIHEKIGSITLTPDPCQKKWGAHEGNDIVNSLPTYEE